MPGEVGNRKTVSMRKKANLNLVENTKAASDNIHRNQCCQIKTFQNPKLKLKKSQK